MRRTLLLTGLLLLTACVKTLPVDSNQSTDSGAVIDAGTGTIGTNEATPENVDSLEVPDVATSAVINMTMENGALTFSATEEDVPTLTEYLDYDCEYCHEYAFSLQPWIMESYVATGKLKVVRRFVALTKKGELFATAALCAAEKDAFDEMDVYLLTHPSADQAAILKQVSVLKIPQATMKYCLTTKKIPEATFSDGTAVTRVPAFEIGKQRWLGVETKLRFSQHIEVGIKQ